MSHNTNGNVLIYSLYNYYVQKSSKGFRYIIHQNRYSENEVLYGSFYLSPAINVRSQPLILEHSYALTKMKSVKNRCHV